MSGVPEGEDRAGLLDESTFAPREVEPRSARQRVAAGPLYEELIVPVRPYRGISLGDSPGPASAIGRVVPSKRDRESAAAITDAGLAVLAELDAGQRLRVLHEADSVDWQHWINTHPNILRHGLLLEDLTPAQRQAVLTLMRRSMSEDGFAQARDIMRINGLLVELTGRAEEFGEWPYFFALFGTPSHDEPWGWQLDGHHLNLNVVVADGHVATTPAFMGSEPCRVTGGRLAGTEVLRAEHEAGLRFMRSLDPQQASIASIRSSIRTRDLPPELAHPINGRTVAGPFRDNLVLSPAGVCGADLRPAQRRILHDLISTYLRWSPPTTAAIRQARASEYLDETTFLWMGEVGDRGPFYYRVLSPAVLIEFDHHAGTVFDNPDPSPNHIHTLVRTPYGGDYGVDLIQRHYERWDHSEGRHRPWS